MISALKISGLAAGAFFSLLSGAAAGEIVGIRFGKTSATETRVVLDAVGEISTLGAPVEAEQVIKIAFDRSTTVSIVPLAGRGDGLIDSYGFNSEGLELKFRSTSKIKSLFVIPPSASNARHRLVVDIERGAPTAAPVAAAALPAPKFDSLTDVIASVAPPTAAVAVTPSSAAPTLKPQPLASVAPPPAAKPVIVIDPGHGGTDPGASGPSGSKEANANLAAGLALAEVLEKTGRYTVVMTRHRDSRLAHEERSRIARSAKADLFISLHADAHTDSKVRGASVYTLSEEGSERSAREALAQGNYHVFDVDIGETDPEVGGILYNLAQRKTENESDRFAEILVDNLQTATLLLNNSHRRGNFKVLLAPDVPAVLLELAFISNKKDEANLGSEAWRTRTMTAVAGAIDAYFADRARALHAGNIPASPTR
ncbi:MAG: N-acetylmuramoyl-L-alanine amidase [Parvularculaceae bacterium]|nr:N-acetylmuramoyl-L-alanine amidase [Parvularculaceae bacterium]